MTAEKNDHDTDYTSLDRFLGSKPTASGKVINEASDDIHTKSGKRKFINDLFAMVKADIIGRVDNMPDAWDGAEMRQYIADKFVSQISIKLDGKRKKDFNNTVNVENL